MRTTMYLHSDKDENFALGDKLGLSDEAMKLFKYALCEVEFEVEVDKKTGEAEIIAVDGKRLVE